MKLIICFAGRVGVRGYRQRDFIYDPALNLYVWKNRRLTPEEFNAVAPQVFADNVVELRPFAKIVEFDQPPGDAVLETRLKELTAALQVAEQNSLNFQAEANRLKAEIGEPPPGSHPAEARPRCVTWHLERLTWQSEVERQRAQLAELAQAGEPGPEAAAAS